MAKQTYDVVVIGSGVIGSSITFELGKRGFKTLTIDKHGGAGLGSTSFSSAIVRFTYSTYAGVAMSYEGLRYWENWSDHVNLKPKSDLAQFHQSGMVSLKDAGGHHDRVLPFFDAIGIPYEHWSEIDFKNRLPELDLHRFGPPSRPEEDQFWDQPTEMLTSDSSGRTKEILSKEGERRRGEGVRGGGGGAMDNFHAQMQTNSNSLMWFRW